MTTMMSNNKQACVWSGSSVEEARAVVEEAEAAEDYSFASKDLLDARLILIQVLFSLLHLRLLAVLMYSNFRIVICLFSFCVMYS